MESGQSFKVIDFNPRVHRELKALGVPCTYGDISHLDTLEDAGVEQARVLISSIPDDFLRGTSNRKLLDSLRRLNPEARILLTAESVAAALELYDAGADYVLLPRVLGADRLMDILASAEAGSLEDLREREIAQLKERKQVGL
jgi:voltage-gated potassium channel Kch